MKSVLRKYAIYKGRRGTQAHMGLLSAPNADLALAMALAKRGPDEPQPDRISIKGDRRMAYSSKLDFVYEIVPWD